MAALIVMMALHYQIIMQPVFRPSLEMIHGHEVVDVIESREGAEMVQPDGAVLSWRYKW